MSQSFTQRIPRVLVVLVAGAAILVAGCGGGEATENETAVEITKGERSPAIPGAKARVVSPEDSTVVEDSTVSIVVEADSFETGVQTETQRAKEIANSSNGQHFHVIVDNQPYMADYTAGEPFDIGALQDGAHSVFVFPSRSYHESVKSENAADILNFWVGEESGEFMLDPSQPTIIYSRPKGTYSGAGAERIMLDFYLHNVELGQNGYKARYAIREAGAGANADSLASITLTEWAPAFVTGLESGTYIVTLDLLDAQGNVVPGGFNHTERKITVKRSESM